MKVAQCGRNSDEPKIPPKLPGGAELRPKPPFQAPNGAAKFLQVPQTPQKPVNRELRPQEAEPSEVARVRKLRKLLTLMMSPKFPEDFPVAPSYGQKRAQKRPDWVSAQFQAKFGPILTDFGPTTKKIDQ